MSSSWYRRAHTNCRKLWGPAKLYPCVDCGGPAAHWAYDGTDRENGGKNYSLHPEFYKPMCPRCHGRFDRDWYLRVHVHVERRKREKPPVPTNPRTEAEWDRYLRARRRAQPRSTA